MHNKSKSKLDLKEINKVNQMTYDKLSDEYENRTSKLTNITKHVIDLFSMYLSSGKNVLETGCAVGLAMKIMTEKGLNVTGIDISEKMVKFSKLRNPKSKIIVGDFLKYKFDYRYDGIFSFAFIHLFPKETAMKVLRKMFNLLKNGGVLYLGTSKSKISYEGWETKADYNLKLNRYRKHWTETELKSALEEIGFKIIHKYILIDPYKKIWMDFVAKKY